LFLGRPPKGKGRYESYLRCEFEAESVDDPIVDATLRRLRVALGVRWDDPVGEVDLRPKPTQAELAVFEVSIQEAFDRATGDLDALGGLPSSLPSLFLDGGGFDKRADDVRSGLRERIDLKREIGNFMRESFPEYRFDSDEWESLWFRKELADGVDGLLLFLRQHEFGLGKCFTLEYRVDLPNTGFAVHTLPRERSLFSLFHRDRPPPEWAYTTKEELAAALGGCRRLLDLALPVLERHLARLLSPLPAGIPPGIPVQGRISALEAFQLSQAITPTLGDDISLFKLASQTPDGRLDPLGDWRLRFHSKKLKCVFAIKVPHTGRVTWSVAGRDSRAPDTIPPGWIDSPRAVEQAWTLLSRIIPSERKAQLGCELGAVPKVRGLAWKISAIVPGEHGGFARSISVFVDATDGRVLLGP